MSEKMTTTPNDQLQPPVGMPPAGAEFQAMDPEAPGRLARAVFLAGNVLKRTVELAPQAASYLDRADVWDRLSARAGAMSGKSKYAAIAVAHGGRFLAGYYDATERRGLSGLNAAGYAGSHAYVRGRNR